MAELKRKKPEELILPENYPTEPEVRDADHVTILFWARSLRGPETEDEEEARDRIIARLGAMKSILSISEDKGD